MKPCYMMRLSLLVLVCHWPLVNAICSLFNVPCSMFNIQSVQAQRHEVYSPDIASLQVVAGTRWMELPVIQLGGSEVVNIGFDDLTHEYRQIGRAHV